MVAYSIGLLVNILDPVTLSAVTKLDETLFAKLTVRLLHEGLKKDSVEIDIPQVDPTSRKLDDLRQLMQRFVRLHRVFVEYAEAAEEINRAVTGVELKVGRVQSRLEVIVSTGASIFRESSEALELIASLSSLKEFALTPEVNQRIRIATAAAGRLYAAVSAVSDNDYARVFVELTAA